MIFFFKGYFIPIYDKKDQCKSKLNMTEPVHYKLRDSVGHTVGSYSYVPNDKVLKNYCSHEDMQDQILCENIPETHLMDTFSNNIHFLKITQMR